MGKVSALYKKILAAVCMLCAALTVSGCELPEYLQEETVLPSSAGERRLTMEELESRASSQEETDESGGDVWQLPENGSFLSEDAGSYAYDQLSDSEKIWYRDMEQAVGTMAEGVKLSDEGIRAGLDESVVDKIFQSVLNDHPELFYVEGYSYTRYTRGDKTVAVEFTGTYSSDAETVLARRQEIERAVEELLRAAPDSEDDYEKIKYAYETLILSTDYDMKAEDNQNIYSVFVRHKSVCQGYAKAFQYLASRLGVECALVQGKVLDTGEGHAWNLVKSNGSYYYVDTTWGDISYQSAELQTEESEGELPQISYDYLCITTEQLLRTHVPDETLLLPECTAEQDNYYVREGALFTEYDEEQLAELVDGRLEQGRYDISLRCADEACYQTMCERLLEQQEIFDYLAGSGVNSFAYTSNDRQLTLTFFMMTNTR
jgi:hypothetical protein